MDKIKSYFWFSLKVLIALAIINLILKAAGSFGAEVESFVANPLAFFKSKTGGSSGP